MMEFYLQSRTHRSKSMNSNLLSMSADTGYGPSGVKGTWCKFTIRNDYGHYLLESVVRDAIIDFRKARDEDAECFFGVVLEAGENDQVRYEFESLDMATFNLGVLLYDYDINCTQTLREGAFRAGSGYENL